MISLVIPDIIVRTSCESLLCRLSTPLEEYSYHQLGEYMSKKMTVMIQTRFALEMTYFDVDMIKFTTQLLNPSYCDSDV